MNDALISFATLAALVAALVIVDDRVRGHVAGAARGITSAGVSGAGAELGTVGPILLAAARDQSLAHGPMVIFVVVAMVLFVCMIRT